MRSRLHHLIVIAGLAWGLPALAVEPQIVEELQAILRLQALSVPDEFQLEALTQGELATGLKAIDPWARRVFSGDENDSAAGIGAELYESENRIWLMPYVDGPLYHAGINDRVELLKLNGMDVANMHLGDIAQALQGDAGDVIQVEICEPACKAPLTLALRLEKLSAPSVENVVLAGQSIIRVRSFVERETKVFLEMLLNTTTNHTPLILDLRDCQGGDLFEAMDSTALFLPAGSELATTYDRHGVKQRFYSPQTTRKITSPLTIWVSSETASSGEIFAGVLQRQGRARLIGMKSRGKCVSQTKKQLSDGSLFYFTNLEIRLPGGVGCQGVGIEPDITISVEELRSSRLILDRLESTGV